MSDPLGLAIDRAAGARPIAGNTLDHHPDSAVALATMLADIAAARRWIHLENYIIRDDHTGRRFADVLAERAAAKVRVRVLYDALGSIGTSHRFWRRLRQAGVAVRAFHPLLSLHPLEVLKRDHRKLLVTDGRTAMTGGLCIGDEWAGDPARGRQPWRDTMVRVCGPAVTALDAAFGRLWLRAGDPLPDDELDADPAECGTSPVRVVAGAPARAHIYRSVQLLAASAAERLWITDAYLLAPPPLYAALLDAAKAGVDVRLLVPGASDLPVLRNFTRVGYRDLLRAGVRVYEWQGPMLHAKTLLVDRRWARVGSSNLNVSSLLTNYELDLIAECEELSEALAAQFRRDLAYSREIVLEPRRLKLPPRLVPAPAVPQGQERAVAHKRSGYEMGAVAVVALRRVAGGLRRAIAWTAALICAGVGALLLAFPRVMSITLAVVAFWLALSFGLFAMQRRRARRADDAA
ncbi:MAG: cardiolipin synthase B [Gemmatimonadetes bacterium]|nr:MAG: cardiolipin synthase B [Gemmatimonadota bacterium]PYO85718.1 MAG: cardiolipin synthase B [Gemmatimonadota bacterium]PYP61502.1 MAG: cardiolipin synthase B [Gemmatimonadota bacterium]